MNNIVLIGMMGSGKTTIGMLLKEKMSSSFEFIDTDKQIEKEQGMLIEQIFERYGEKYFRLLESALINNLKDSFNLIIATGGGVVLNGENMENLGRNSKIFYLDSDVEILKKRVRGDKSRPLRENLKEIYDERKDLYNRFCDFVINCNNRIDEEIVSEIICIYESVMVND